MIHLLQCYDNAIVSHAKHSAFSAQSYAMRHGYTYSSHPCRPETPPYWNKVFTLLDLILTRPASQAEWFFYLDSDTMIQQPDVPLTKFTHQMGGFNIGICDDTVNGGRVNTGALLIRNLSDMAHVLQQWIATGIQRRLMYTALWDQTAFVHLYDESPLVRSMTKVFPHDAFNSNGVGPIPPSNFIAHFMARSVEEKNALMAESWRLQHG